MNITQYEYDTVCISHYEYYTLENKGGVKHTVLS